MLDYYKLFLFLKVSRGLGLAASWPPGGGGVGLAEPPESSSFGFLKESVCFIVFLKESL